MWASLIACGAGAVTSISIARNATSPALGTLDLLYWIASGADPLASLAAVFSGLSGGYSIWQLFQRQPPSKGDLEFLVERALDSASGRQAELSAKVIETHQKSEHRDGLTRQLLTGDILERLKVALRAGALGDGERAELIEAVASSLQSISPGDSRVADDFAEAVGTLASSNLAEDRNRAAKVVEGKIDEAARSLLKGHSNSPDAAFRARLAAHLYQPFDVEKATKAREAAVQKDPLDCLGWADLAAAYRKIGNLRDARDAAITATKRARGPWDRFIVEYELACISYANYDVGGCLAQLEAAATFYEKIEEPNKIKPTNQRFVSDFHNLQGLALLCFRDYKEANEAFKSSEIILERLCKRHPTSWRYALDLGWLKHLRSDAALRLGDISEARELSAIAISNYEPESEKNSSSMASLGDIYRLRFQIERTADEIATALEYLKKSIVALETSAEDDPENIITKESLCRSYYEMAEYKFGRNDVLNSRIYAARSLFLQDTLVKMQPSNNGYRYELYVTYILIGRINGKENNPRVALEWFEKAEIGLNELKSQGQDDPIIDDTFNDLSDFINMAYDHMADSMGRLD